MANVLAVHSAGQSLVTALRNAYPQSLRDIHSCDFSLISSGELAKEKDIETALTLYLYRVTMNEHLRSARRPGEPFDESTPLSVDLHYLMTVWADSAVAEHAILAWAMLQLHHHPVLDRSSLSPEADWNPGDFVQVIPAELSNEDIMRIWDALEPSYRLSVSYIARVVRINAERPAPMRPAVATRFAVAGALEGP